MKIANLSDFRSWFVGKFDPSFLKEDFEVGIKTYKKGDLDPTHYHKECSEITLVLEGSAQFLVNGAKHILEKDQLILIEPMERCQFLALEDCKLLCIKTKSDPTDKWLAK